MNWIPLTTRPSNKDDEYERYFEFVYDCELPEEGVRVLVSEDGYVFVDELVSSSLGGFFFDIADEPDAWMPLPEPYKKVGE